MSLANLNLDQEQVEILLDNHRKDGTLVEEDVKGNGSRHCHFLINDDPCLLIFFFKKSGETTIQTTSGPNPDLSKSIANEIKDRSILSQTGSANYTFFNISADQIDLFKDYVVEEIPGAKISVTEPTDTQSIFKLEGRYNDKATVNYYKGRGTVLLQGKPLPILQEAKLFFWEIADLKDIIENESNIYEIPLEKDELHEKLKAHLPKAISFLDKKIVKILTPAMALEGINIDLPDYSMFVFPVLRGMEGYIRQLLKAKYSGHNNTNKIGSLFGDYVEHKGFPLSDHAKTDIRCTDTICALEIAYTKYHRLRHPYFHVDKDIPSAPIIERKDVALALTMDVLTTIESTYTPMITK